MRDDSGSPMPLAVLTSLREAPWLALLWDCSTFNPQEVMVGAVLSPAEQQRLATMTHPAVARNFAAGRWLLRHCLAELTGIAPASLVIELGENDKPQLSLPPGTAQPWAFNISHSQSHIAILLSRAGGVGVDLEHVTRAIAPEPLVERFCTLQEQRWFAVQPRDQQRLAFLRLWSVKEACLKAWGSGIARGFDSFSVLLDEQRTVLHDPQVAGDVGPVTVWQMQNTAGLLVSCAGAGRLCDKPPVVYQIDAHGNKSTATLQLFLQDSSWCCLSSCV